MFTDDLRGAVAEAFEQVGYFGSLRVAPITSSDERVFLLNGRALANVRNMRALEQELQQILGLKVWVVEQTASWPTAITFE